MDRDEVVRISRLVAFGGLTETEVSILLMQYCLEHNKPYYESTVFVTLLIKVWGYNALLYGSIGIL